MCLNEDEANYMLRELHEWIYESHIAGASLAFKALRNGYFWLTMKLDVLNWIKSVTNANDMLTYQEGHLLNNYPLLLDGHLVSGGLISKAFS